MIPEAQLAWKKVNLPELQKQLDVQSLQLFSTQTASLESRKKLAEFTREFKKNPNPEGPEIKALLKLYQNEIDSINKRSKAAESAFLNLYKVLAEVPDPCPVFELTIDQQEKMTELDSLKQENKKLKEDLEQSKNSTATTKLLEADIINLQKKLEDAEVLKDTAINEKVMEITTELKQEMEDKIHVFKETEHSLNRQLSHLKDQLISQQNTHEFQQATSNTDHYNENVAAKLAELDIIQLDLQKANGKVTFLSRENISLKKQLKQSEKDSILKLQLKENEDRLKKSEVEIIALEKSLKESNELVEEHKAELSKLNIALEREIVKHNFDIAQTKTQLLEYSDYEEIKRELEIFKGMETDHVESPGKSVPLERLVMDRNKKLENENTDLKMSLSAVKETLALKEQLSATLEDDNAKKTQLIAKLEADIHHLNYLQNHQPLSPTEHLESLVSDLGPTTSKKPSSTADNSIVPILTSQRDRFRQRYEEASRKTHELQSRLSILTDDFHRLEKDNVALYEKLRYQENYQSGRMQRPNSYVGINIDSESSSRQRNDVTEKYHNLYEETINPFRQFKNQETVRGQSLNPAERVAMQFTKLLTGNKYSRLLFVAYAILLHFLVFFCMYEVMTQGPAEVKRQGNIHFDKPNTPDT